jgi:riboflavin synthase
MFSGIISDIGEIVAITGEQEKYVVIATNYDLAAIKLGSSIACAGICLTVANKSANKFEVLVSKATTSCTSAINWQVGQKINLEQALKFGEEVGGHLVSAHIDDVGEITKFAAIEQSWELVVKIPARLLKYVAPKGSIAIDGVSLTVNSVIDSQISINIIPHTMKHTCFQNAQVGDVVNIEIDPMARQVVRYLEMFQKC